MKFGHFSDTAREYVITTPRTPLPWINYLGSEAFFSLVSHTAGGYSFYRDAKHHRAQHLDIVLHGKSGTAMQPFFSTHRAENLKK